MENVTQSKGIGLHKVKGEGYRRKGLGLQKVRERVTQGKGESCTR